VAVLHYTAAPVPGGVEAAASAQARELRKAGYDVRLVAGHGDAEVVQEVGSRHPDVERVTRQLAAGDLRGFESLRRRVRDALRPVLGDRDVVIAHNVLTMPFNLPLTAALVDRGRPLVAWTHDLAWSSGQYEAYRRPEWPFCLLGTPQPGVRYVAISRLRQLEMARALGLAAREVPVVPNGVDPFELAGLGPRALALLRRAEALAADPLLLVPLRVTPRKRLELAFEAAAALLPRLPGLRVVVTGPLGPHSADNRAYAERLLALRSEWGLEGAVRFLFELSPPGGDHPVRSRDVAELYRVSDAVLVPSEAEGFGLPLVEAALARVPVVCADLPVLREVGGPGLFTFSAEADGREVARAVERALAQRSTRQRRRAMRRYAWPTVVARTERVIRAAVGQ
jgi:glycosyltransferase involved in cell wall biosynthesis